MSTIYDKLDNIEVLSNYRIHEGNIGCFNTNIIFAANKINDIYFTYSSARANLHFLSNEDFGDFAKDDISILYNRVLLVNSALFYYNILIDLSWQLVWLFYSYESIGKMPTTKLYEKLSKDCTKDKLEFLLTLARENKIRDFYIRDFFENPLTKKIREKYNYMKHRGTYYYRGLGRNYEKSSGIINNYNIPLIHKEEIDIDALKQELLDLDILYGKYLFALIDILIPKSFLKTNDCIYSTINYYFKYEKDLKLLNN